MERKFKVGDTVRPRFGDEKEYTVIGYQNIGAISIFGGDDSASVVCVRTDENGNILQSYHDEGLLSIVKR